MARGRFITASLGASHKLASVKSDAHRLMYVLMVVNTDVEGRLDADPRILNGRVFTLMDWSIETVEAGLQALADADLILWYEVDGRPFAEIVRFHEHNSVRKDREQPSRIPVASEGKPIPNKDDAGLLRENSGSTPAQEKLSQVQIKPSISQELSSASPTREETYSVYLEEWNKHCGILPQCGTLNDKRRRGIDAIQKELGTEALHRFIEATQFAAGDPYWQEHGYNIDNLLVRGRVLEKAEKHRANRGMTSSNRSMASSAMRIMAAIGADNAN